MNLSFLEEKGQKKGIPRVSGDEPQGERLKALRKAYSPRERG